MDILSNMKLSHFFSGSEQAVINYIFNHPEDIEYLSIRKLSEYTFTSTSTIIRLYRKLGCKNYSEFKIQLCSALQNNAHQNINIDANFPFKKNDTFLETNHNLGLLISNSINETMALIEKNEEIYKKCIDILYNAEVIDFYGVATNLSLAFDFKLSLMRINHKVNVPISYQEQILSAAYSSPKHVSIIISYTGETTETLKCCKLLKKTGSKMICITNTGNTSISDLCDYSLHIVSKEKMFSKIGMFSSKYSIMVILDILYSGIFQKNYDDNIKLTIEKRMLTTPFRSKVGSLIEEF